MIGQKRVRWGRGEENRTLQYRKEVVIVNSHNIFVLTTALATATESLPYVDEMVARYCGNRL